MYERPGYRIDSSYSTDGVIYELRATGSGVGDPGLDIELPDATPAGEHFTSMGPQHAVVRARAGSVPWPVLYWFLGKVLSVGDMSGLRGPARPMPDREVWTHDGERYTVGPHTLSDGATVIEAVPGESLTVHGSCRIPWPVLRRFLEAVERS